MKPCLLFNEGNLSSDQKQQIVNTTDRPVHFPEIPFDEYPEGFDPVNEIPNWATSRSKLAYQQIC